MLNANGMIQFEGATYRIAEVSAGRYQAFRVLDDASMGRFEMLPVVLLEAEGCVDAVLFGIAHAALMQGKTRYPPFRRVRDDDVVVRAEDRNVVEVRQPESLAATMSWFQSLRHSMLGCLARIGACLPAPPDCRAG